MKRLAVLSVLLPVCIWGGNARAADAEVQTLPATRPLTWTGDLSARIVEGAGRFLDRKLAESVAKRKRYWRPDTSSAVAYEKSIGPNRRRFRKIIGLVDQRVPVAMERFGDEDNPALVAQTGGYGVWQVRWGVLPGVFGEGLLLEPKGKPAACVVALADADQTPEQIAGLAGGVAPQSQFARRLAENGCRVVVPVLIDRACTFSGNPKVAMTNQPHREWIYRQAYEMGRHVIGYDVQKVLAVVDWFKAHAGGDVKVGVAGYAEGGLIAFYSAAADTRIDACLVSGYFDSRQRVWEEPIYRNVWSLLREFGDAEIAGLIAPRRLVIEYSPVPQVDGPPTPAKGRRGGAAPGRLATPDVKSVSGELARLQKLDTAGCAPKRIVLGEDDRPIDFGSQAAMKEFAGELGLECDMSLAADLPIDRRKGFDPLARQKRQVGQLTDHIQLVERLSDRVRKKFFLDKVKRDSVEAFVQGAKKYREHFRNEVIGWLDEQALPPDPRSRKIYDEPEWTGYEVVLDLWPEVPVWGILCLPKDITPGQKRPVVVCQHGLEGVPEDVITTDARAHRYYSAFAARLAQRGFVTFAPYNLYRGRDKFRMLQRKANPLGASLFSIIARQHQQILDWLGSLPYVDKQRIGFYGLSYGGKSAMRLPALLEGYCLSICSADFNDWIRKNVSVHAPYSYMFTGEWEMFEFDLGRTFNYAEMAYLILPRPFMVERGHHDGVAPDEWVAYEYAKIRWLYVQLGLGDRTEIEFFNGPHSINAQGTFRFLHKHLDWPAPEG